VKLLYFAWLRTRTGIAQEEVTPPAEVADVAGLLSWLKGRGPNFAAALADPAVVKVAVNQEYVKPDHPVRAGDEVALFPPVTGG
jgi:sulfur-carrier protein